jgi:hypothetical protein
MKPKGSLSRSQETTVGAYSEPGESVHILSFHFKAHFNIIFLTRLGCPTIIMYTLWPIWCVLHAASIINLHIILWYVNSATVNVVKTKNEELK